MKPLLKNLFLFVLFIGLSLECACAKNPNVGVLIEGDSYEKSAKQVRKTIFLEQKREASDYTEFVFTEMRPYIENALVENDLIVTKNKEQADFIGFVDFGTEEGRAVTKTFTRPHYEYFPDYPYGYDDYGYGAGRYVNTGTETYTKTYTVYPQHLLITCCEQKLGKTAEAWEVEIVYNSKYDDFRVNIKNLIDPLSEKIKEAISFQNVVSYEYDKLD